MSDRIVIIGGGIVGAATAYWLTRLGRETAAAAEVLVLEPDPTYARASTTLSAASIRQQFSTPENIRLSRFGLETLRGAEAALGVDPQFRERGYLLLAGAGGAETLRSNHRAQAAEGAEIALLEPAALIERFPWLSADGAALGALGLSGEGWFDSAALLQGFRKTSAAQGAVWRQAAAAGLETAGGRIAAVRLADGERIAADWVVNAAGPAAARVAGWAGIALPVEARKRTVFYIHARDAEAVSAACPLLVDPSGVYVRPEGQGFICGVSPPEGQDPACDPATDPLTPDWDLFEAVVWPALAGRIPLFEAVKPQSAWAGFYAFNTLDQNALIGRHPAVENLLFANGFSGHGLQQGPGAGRGLAETILRGGYRSLDLSVFDVGRIETGRRVRELNVI